MTQKNKLKKYQNKGRTSIIIISFALVLVLAGVSQAIVNSVIGDRAQAATNTYLTSIGFNNVEPVSDAFNESSTICLSRDDSCVKGLIDYQFNNLQNQQNIVAGIGGGIILNKASANAFHSSGNLTSKNFTVRSGYQNVKITKLQVGLGLKEGNSIDISYSTDGGTTFKSALTNYTVAQLQSQTTQTVAEFNLAQPETVTSGFVYKVNLKTTNSLKSPSLKFVRVFYTSNIISSSSSSNAAISSSSSSTSSTPSSSSSISSSSSSSSSIRSSSSSSVARPPIPGGPGENL